MGILPGLIHADPMPQQAYASLLPQCVHAVDSTSLQDAFVFDYVLPGDVQYATNTVHMEHIKLIFLSGTQGPPRTAV